MTDTGSDKDEIRILTDGFRLLEGNISVDLVARGWAVKDLDVADDDPLEFFWPPTAPPGYGGGPVVDPVAQRRPGMALPRLTPWCRPTRITREDNGAWRVDYGEAVARKPDASTVHVQDSDLLSDLPRIEWWPMSVEEAQEVQRERVYSRTQADAYDQHHLGCPFETEPYTSQVQELRDHLYSAGLVPGADPEPWRWEGDLSARLRLIDAQAWASAVRTLRAGGDDWDPSGQKDGKHTGGSL